MSGHQSWVVFFFTLSLFLSNCSDSEEWLELWRVLLSEEQTLRTQSLAMPALIFSHSFPKGWEPCSVTLLEQPFLKLFFFFFPINSRNQLGADYWAHLLLSWGPSSKGNHFGKTSFYLRFSRLACFCTSSVSCWLLCTLCWLELSLLSSVKEALSVHLGSITFAFENIPGLPWYL